MAALNRTGIIRATVFDFDELRRREYSRLDGARHVYLDYTGAGLYADSQITEHARFLRDHVFGNPHSASVTSSATTTAVERARRAVLSFFNAPHDQYTAIFTLNASAALKLVGESYPFRPGGRTVLTFDNHNSVNGIREFAKLRGCEVAYAPLTTPELRLDLPRLHALLDENAPSVPQLFAFPAQSNFSGVKHPLALVEHAQTRGWDVLLDAAAFVPANRLDLQRIRPAFVALSFYKMFGYPTGVGCLIARHDALARLERPWFAGGTVNFATVQGQRHRLAPGEAGFEDGTLNFLDIPAIEIGLRHLESVGVERIHNHVTGLTDRLLSQLVELRHDNGRPLVRIYGPMTTAARGGTVTMNFYDPDGHLMDYRRIEELASARNISVRTGCFCNPGAGESAEALTEDDMLAGLDDHDITLPRFLQIIQHRGGKSAGAIRASLGIASNVADVQTFVDFAAGFRNQTRLAIGDATFDIASCRVIRDGS
jgi:selenocysteine lyase/cysteine desulfurase